MVTYLPSVLSNQEMQAYVSKLRKTVDEGIREASRGSSSEFFRMKNELRNSFDFWVEEYNLIQGE